MAIASLPPRPPAASTRRVHPPYPARRVGSAASIERRLLGLALVNDVLAASLGAADAPTPQLAGLKLGGQWAPGVEWAPRGALDLAAASEGLHGAGALDTLLG